MNRLSVLKSMLEEEPDSSFLKYGIALEHYKEGKKSVGMAHLMDLREADKNYLALYYTLAKWLDDEGDKDKAIEICLEGQSIAANQGDAKALSELKNLTREIEGEDDW